MKTYYFWDMQGRYAGAYDAAEGEEMLADSTAIAPPELADDYCAVWAGDCWIINRA